MRVQFIYLALAGMHLATAAVTGSVTDLNGAGIPAAEVTITGQGFREVAITNEDGVYSIPVPAGTYSITAVGVGFAKTDAVSITVQPDRNRYHDFALTPAPLVPDEILVHSIADAASQRPGYLPNSAVAPGSSVIISGRFVVQEKITAPLETEIAGHRFVASNADGGAEALRLASISPTEARAILPSTVTPGRWILTASSGGKSSRPIKFNVAPWAPKLFSENASGFGPGRFFDSSGAPLTAINPARPGGTYQINITNVGAVPNDTQPEFFNKMDDYGLAAGRLGRSYFGRERISFFGGSNLPGVGVVEFTLPDEVALAGTIGCAVPFQVGAGDPTVWSNEVTIPVSASGPCGDPVSLTSSDHERLAVGNGLRAGDAVVTEASFLRTSGGNLNRRDLILASLKALALSWHNYSPPPPPGSCAYRWEPIGGFTGVAAPTNLTLGGTASVTVPWGVFNFSQTSNNGPFNLLFGAPASYPDGNYSIEYGTTFTVDSRPMTFRATGQYRRNAGRVRTHIADSIGAKDFSLLDWYELIQRIHRDTPLEPSGAAQFLNLDIGLRIDNGTLGAHLVRCNLPATGSLDVGTLLAPYRQLLPSRANNFDLAFRWTDSSRSRFVHTGAPLDFTNVLFDSTITLQDVVYERPGSGEQ